jgi:DNA-binding GntR family transcriptional regulator
MENYQQVKELLILIRNVDAARMRYSHVEHRKIVEAVLRGHKELAVRYLEQHLDNARHATLRSTAAMDGLG